MYIDFSGLFHRSSKDMTMGGTHMIPESEADWPEEWNTVYYKTYEMDSIALPDTQPAADLFEAVRTRHSARHYSGRKLKIDEISTLLRYSCGIVGQQNEFMRRAQPSGGARYPVEVYPIFFIGGDVPSGIYHYDIKNHALDVLHQKEFAPEEARALFSHEFMSHASCAIVMTAVFPRTQNKYGERGYRYILLEAGHIGQNLYLGSSALGIGCCSVAGALDEKIEALLGIDGVTESVVYVLLLG